MSRSGPRLVGSVVVGWVITGVLGAQTVTAQISAASSEPRESVTVPIAPRSLVPPRSVVSPASLIGAPLVIGGVAPHAARGAIISPASITAGDRRQPRIQSGATRAGGSWWAPLASAIAPGAGQVMLRQDRAVAYLAVEGYAWLRYASDVREARRQRHAYRALAATVARAYFAPDFPPGDFEYYERMEHFVESGVYDMLPGNEVDPETDTETFNGALWLRARSTFWEDPAMPPPPGSDAHRAALAYYEGRAIQPAFRWSWRDAQLEQDLFRRTITRSNDAFRRSIQDLGVVIANHALSTVDAYIAVRVRRMDTASNAVGVVATLPWSPRLPPPNQRDDER